jgi:hypothetical protein
MISTEIIDALTSKSGHALCFTENRWSLNTLIAITLATKVENETFTNPTVLIPQLDKMLSLGPLYERGIKLDHPLILSSVQLMNDQIKRDFENLNSGNLKDLTLVGEWAPREGSSFGFLYTTLATNYFKN